MLYPLSYEGKTLENARNTALFGLSGRSKTASDVHLGRTITSIHRFCEASEVIFEQSVYRSRVFCAQECPSILFTA